MGAVGNLGDDQWIPEVQHDSTFGLHAETQQPDDHQCRREIEAHHHHLQRERHRWSSQRTRGEDQLGNRKVWRSQVGVVGEVPGRNVQRIQSRCIEGVGVRIHTGCRNMAVPQVAVYVVAQRGRRRQHQQPEHDGDGPQPNHGDWMPMVPPNGHEERDECHEIPGDRGRRELVPEGAGSSVECHQLAVRHKAEAGDDRESPPGADPSDDRFSQKLARRRSTRSGGRQCREASRGIGRSARGPSRGSPPRSHPRHRRRSQ